MGVYEDIMATLTGAADSFASGTGMGRFDEYQRARAELEAYAASRGWDKSKDPLGIQLSRDFPDEFAAVEAMNPAGGVALSAGMLPSAAAARGALPPPRAAAGEVIPPPRPAGSPPPSSGPIIDGTSYTPPPPPRATSGGQALPPGPPPPPPAGASAASPAPSPQGGPGRWTIPGIIAASALPVVAGAMQRNQARATPSAEQGEYGRGAGPTESEIEAAARQQAHLEQVERERQRDHVLNRNEREAQVALQEAQAAYAQAQRAELEKRLANADMTDSQKEQARAALEREMEAGRNARNRDDIASRERTTAMNEEGANARNRATTESNERIASQREAGDDRRTGANIASNERMTVYRGDVDMRGQDLDARADKDNFATTMLARGVETGRLSVEKANKMLADYIAMSKLPTDILKQVSDSIQPFLPYMRNGNPGDIPAGFEPGGARDALAKLAGVKPSGKPRTGYSDFNLMDIAAQYGGGPPPTPPKQLDVEATYNAIQTPTLENMNADLERYRAQSSVGAPAPRPSMGGGQTPPMVESLMPQTMTPPMAPDAEQRIYNSLGR